MTTIAVVVDAQVDFCEGGALPVAGGNAVAAGIAQLLQARAYDLVIASRDAHNPLPDTNGGHFAAAGETPYWQHTWPVHCVDGTPGAEYHPLVAAALPAGTLHVKEGAGQPSYSALEGLATNDQSLEAYLTERWGDGAGIEIHLMGLATDYAVLATGLGFRRVLPQAQVVLLAGLCAGVEPDVTQAIGDLLRAGVRIVTGPADSAVNGTLRSDSA